LATQLSEARSQQYAADHAVSDLENRLAGLEGADRCPTCNSILKKGEAAKHLHELKAEVFRLNGEAEAAQELGDDIGEQAAQKQAEVDKAERKARPKFDLTREQASIQMELAKAETIAVRRRDITKVSRDKIAEVKAIRAETNPYTVQITKAEAAIKKHRKTIKTARASLKTKAAERAHLEFWVRGFSPTGLPSFLLDSVMPYLTERANHYLDALADGDIQMGFSTQRELKSAKGEFRDEIDISWIIEGKEGYPPSGGQFKKMEIATDLALMDLAATREGGHLDLLCLDECLDGLDGEGRTRIIQLLQGLRKSRSTIYVISHDPGVAEAFERAAVVVKQDGVARLEAA
jgi:DNA repair exonuclease SbcCD ATPase subunit